MLSNHQKQEVPAILEYMQDVAREAVGSSRHEICGLSR
jgi:hypothetical protein